MKYTHTIVAVYPHPTHPEREVARACSYNEASRICDALNKVVISDSLNGYGSIRIPHEIRMINGEMEK